MDPWVGLQYEAAAKAGAQEAPRNGHWLCASGRFGHRAMYRWVLGCTGNKLAKRWWELVRPGTEHGRTRGVCLAIEPIGRAHLRPFGGSHQMERLCIEKGVVWGQGRMSPETSLASPTVAGALRFFFSDF